MFLKVAATFVEVWAFLGSDRSVCPLDRRELRQAGKILPFQGGLPILTAAGGVAGLFKEHWRLYVWKGSIMKQYVGSMTY